MSLALSVAQSVRRSPPLRRREQRSPRLLLLYGVLFLPTAALMSAAYWPIWQHRPVLAIGNEFLSLALLAAGILLLDVAGPADAGNLAPWLKRTHHRGLAG